MYDVVSIRRSNPIAEVIAASGIDLRQAGRRFVGRCPFHRDGEPSLVVYPSNQSYFCFGCGAGGDAIDFVARLNGLGFKEAAALLAGTEAQHTTAVGSAEPPKPAPVSALNAVEAEIIDATAWFCHEALWRSTAALTYLESRGISRATARRCRLGFGHPGLAHHLGRHGLSLAAAHGLGLLSGERNRLLERVVVPEIRTGRATWLTGRSLDGREPRYLNLQVATPLLGLDRVRSEQVIVTEGPFDWLTAVEWDLPAVALAGSRASRVTLRVLGRFRKVYLALDNDEAGQRAASQLAALLPDRARIVELPDGVKDLNDLATRGDGRSSFLRCLRAADSERKNRWES